MGWGGVWGGMGWTGMDGNRRGWTGADNGDW